MPDGFTLPQAKSSVIWYDRDTLLLASALGEGHATGSGYARTIRLWRRGADPLTAPVIFEIDAGHMSAGVQVDREEPSKRLSFIDRWDFFNGAIWLGDLTGAKTKLDIPSDISSYWPRGWYVLRPKSPWTIGATTYPPGMLLGTAPLEITEARLGEYLAAVRETEPCYRDAGLAHPGLLLRLCNQALVHNVVLGPWIHVGSSVRNFAAARVGDTLTARARVTANEERKGHRIVELDVLLVAQDDRVLAAVAHTAIWRPRQVG